MAKTKKDDFEGSEHWNEFRLITYVKARQQDDGSYLVQGVKDQWTVSEHDFHTNYKPLTPNKS